MCRSLLLIALMLTLPGCATYSQLFVNAQGEIVQCSATGQGLIGMAVASNAVGDCEDNMRAAGYLEIESAGVIGVTLSDTEKGTSPRILKVNAASPAANAGVQAGDRVVSIDGQSVLSTTDAKHLLFGVAGSPVEIVIDKGGQLSTYRIIRTSYTRVYGKGNSRPEPNRSALRKTLGSSTDEESQAHPAPSQTPNMIPEYDESLPDTITITSGDVEFGCNGQVRIMYRDLGWNDQRLEFKGIEGISNKPSGNFRGTVTAAESGKVFYLRLPDDSIYRIEVIELKKRVTIVVTPS